jgi:hypothetical protein
MEKRKHSEQERTYSEIFDDYLRRRKIRLIEGNVKCRHLKKFTFKKGLCGGC